jgi:ABC-2 type transport system permease protein
MPAIITLNSLSKHYKVPLRERGLTFIIPVAFAVTIPAEALTSRLTPLVLAGTFALTVTITIVGRIIWHLGL